MEPKKTENTDFIIQKTNSRNGTSLTGFIHLKYNELKKIFGKPNFGLSGDAKVEKEWVLTINGTVVTIYNYKTGPTYLNDKKITLNSIFPWHVGGYTRSSVDMLKIYIESISDDYKGCVIHLKW